jgi:hypothetical protein
MAYRYVFGQDTGIQFPNRVRGCTIDIAETIELTLYLWTGG